MVGGNILIHHTRNTAQKQWAETQVLTLSGVARVFNTKRQLLQALGDFSSAWSLLLEFIENAALSKNNEVSFAALKSFQEILYLNKGQSADHKAISNEEMDIWAVAWKAWLKIGLEVTIPVLENEVTEDFYLPSQAFLTALIQIFPSVFQHVKSTFNLEDLKQFCVVLTNTVAIPIHGESPTYILPSSTDITLTPLHDGILHSIELLQKEATTRNSKMIPDIFQQLLIFGKFTCNPPNFSKFELKYQNRLTSECISTNYIPFGEKSISMAVKLYEKTAEITDVINANILHDIIVTLHTPLALKYNCVSSSTWKLAANSLITILKVGLPVARTYANQFTSLWNELAATLNEFLFPKTLVIKN